MLVNPSPLWLVHSLAIQKLKSETNQWNQPEYDEPFTVSNVRFDHNVSTSGTANQRTVDNDGTIFIFTFNQSSGLTVDDSWLGAKVTDFATKKVYEVIGYTPYTQDTTSDIYSYEVAVKYG